MERSYLLTSAQWIRFGQVCALTPELAKESSNWPAIPPWFYALERVRREAEPNAVVMDLPLAQELLTSDGVPRDSIPIVIISTFFATLNAHSSSMVKTWEVLGNTEGAHQFLALLRPYANQLPAILAPARAEIKVAAIKWLSLHPPFLPWLAPMLSEWAVSSVKSVRQAAVEVITVMAEPSRSHMISTALTTGTAANLSTVIDAAARMGNAGQRLLEEALAQSRSAKIDEMLTTALEQTRMGADTVVTLDFIPMAPPVDHTPLGTGFTARLDAWIQKAVPSLRRGAAENPQYFWLRDSLARFSAMDYRYCETVTSWLNGHQPAPPNVYYLPWEQLEGMTLLTAVRASAELHTHKGRFHPHSYWLNNVVRSPYDLRTLAQAITEAGIPHAFYAIDAMIFDWNGLHGFSPEQVWPYFAQNPTRIDEALGLIPDRWNLEKRYGSDDVGTALKILSMFPVMPPKYLPILIQYATGEAKTYRRRAQILLEKQPNVLLPAIQGLSNGKGEVRAIAAAWIARIGDPGAIKPLQLALTKEKRELPQAAILTALKTLGDDISAYLTPEILGQAAEKGLAGKPPKGMEWFPLDKLPPCRWADGLPVDPRILQWWTVLAIKLKDPLGAGLIPIYVSLLDKPSQHNLGSFILDIWIAKDTKGPPDEECRAFAAEHVGSHYASNQHYAKKYPQDFGYLGLKTKEDVYEELRRLKAKEYRDSAVNEKGVLALTTGAAGHLVYSTIMRFSRDHGTHRSQLEALVTAASGNDDPAAIQLVLSVARKFKQESVRVKAVELCEAIAQRRGWSLDELADRTIPTAGFDDDGVLVLDYGNREFTSRISRSEKSHGFTISVFNRDGKPLTALPKPGVHDDQPLAQAALTQLGTSKKELSQVFTLQSSRLYEAMCVGRTWDGQTWIEVLGNHPVMCHLVSTLVWSLRENGTYRLFRPSADKTLTDINGNPITISDQGLISLAHLTTVTPDEAKQWKAQLTSIKALFPQFDASHPPVDLNAEDITDHQGWLSDTFAIRNRATKRGYKHSPAEDGSRFWGYFKQFTSAGIDVTIEFTGSMLPEEKVPAAVDKLLFSNEEGQMGLGEVPPILLAEAYADYVFVAQAGQFDPSWRVKSGY